MERKSFIMVLATGMIVMLANGCKPDLTLSDVSVNWDDNQQSVSFTVENKGGPATYPFEVQLMLNEGEDSGREIVHTIPASGLGIGQKLEFRNLSLRYLLDPENECLSRVTTAVFYIDSRDENAESNEENNRVVVPVPAIHVDCEEMVRFEDLASGIDYTPISHIASDGVRFAIRALPGQGEYASIRRGLAVGHGQLLWLKNVWLQPKLATPRHYIAFDARHFMGGIYLEVNGDTGDSPYADAAAIDGITIGGVSVGVSGQGDNPGVWYFTGAINSFKVGGQSLAIDNMLFWRQQKRML